MMLDEFIEKVYNHIMNREIEKANKIIDILIKEYNFERRNILTKIKKYNSDINGDEETFNKNYEFYKATKCKYFKLAYPIIIKYINNEEINGISVMEKEALKTLRERCNEFTKIIDEIISKAEVHNSLGFLDIAPNSTKNYEIEFYQLYKSSNPIDLYKKFNWDGKKFYSKLQLFKQKYQSKKDQEIANYLEEKFNEYLKIYNHIKIVVPVASTGIEKELIASLLNANCSIYEYCDKNYKYSVGEIKQALKTFYGCKAPEIIQKLNSIESPRLDCKLNYIAYKIKTDPNFDILEYYSLTKLSPKDFYKKMQIEDRIISKFVSNNSKGSYIDRAKYLSFNKNYVLKTTYIVRGKVITEEEKQMIFKFLDDNEIPFNQFTYRACQNKYLDGKIDSIHKIKIHKGSF